MSLEVQSQQTRQAIADHLHKTFFRRYWRAIGTFIGRGKVASIWVSAAVVMLANLIAGVVVSALLGETRFTNPETIFNNLVWVSYTYFMIPLGLAINERLVEFLRTRLLKSLQNEGQIKELQTWAEKWLGRVFLQLLFSLGYSIVIAPFSFYVVYNTTEFSLGVLLVYFINFFHLGAAFYGLISLIAFLMKLRNWSLRLYPDNPASSIILLQLSQELRNYILIFSFAITLFMILLVLTGALNTTSIFGTLFFNWIPILALFSLGNYVFSRLIQRVKHERLDVLQSKLMKLSSMNEVDTKKTTQIMTLMDYYDRVKATPNSLINSQSIVNLLGSLALPLLTLLIQAWPYIQNLFR